MDPQDVQQLENETKQLGEYLFMLLETADIKEEDKAAFVAMLPHLSPEEIDKLIKTLEQQVPDGGKELPELEKKINQLNAEYEKKEQEILNSTMKELDDLEKMIDEGTI